MLKKYNTRSLHLVVDTLGGGIKKDIIDIFKNEWVEFLNNGTRLKFIDNAASAVDPAGNRCY